MPQLNDVEKYYIEGNLDIDVVDLARKMKVSVPLVRNYVKRLEAAKVEAGLAAEKAKLASVTEVKPKTVDDLMIKNKKRGVVVMTPEASQIGDATRKSTKYKIGSKEVHQIRPE